MQRGDRVRLLRDLDEVRAGSEGRVFGFLRRPEGDSFAVAFDRGPTRIVGPDDLARLDEDELVDLLQGL